MSPRILVTGIPGHLTRFVQKAEDTRVFYSEKQPQPEGKEDFLRELKNITNTGNYLIGEGALRALSPTATQNSFLASL